MSEIAFTKYDTKGAYHWAEIDPASPSFNAYTAGRFDVAIDCLAKAGVGPGQRLIDVGCGDGALSGVAWRKLRAEVTGIDPSEAAIRHAREQFSERGMNGNFMVGSAYATGVPDESFDAAVCADVIEHVGEPERLLREIHRILRPGGVLVLTTPVRVSERPFDSFHVQEWFPDAFAAMVERSFGKPERRVLTHPALWLEVQLRGGSRLWNWVRVWMRLMAKAGRNPFVHGASNWRLPTQQSLVLRKGGG